MQRSLKHLEFSLYLTSACLSDVHPQIRRMHSFQQIDHQLQLDGQFIKMRHKYTNLHQARHVQNTKRLSHFNNVLTLLFSIPP